MGKHMANNLLKSGKKVVVFDISDKAIAEVEANGGVGAGTPAEYVCRIGVLCGV